MAGLSLAARYRWNQVANVVFLEAPAGVGFSYADTPDGIKHNDTSTAEDNLAAMEDFFQNFPEFKNNDFFISGESYAGAYVPMLAMQASNRRRIQKGTRVLISLWDSQMSGRVPG